ncbi:hypothetical protein D3C80_1137250 [compost metagenome]
MATKAELCVEIFKQLVAQHGDNFKVIRAEFIVRAVAEAGCTTAGAATYYANCKNRGGATGETRERHQVDPNYVSPYANKPDNNKPDDRPLYSAVQRDKSNKVAHVAAYFNPTDALVRSGKVRGYAVLGAPEIGEELDTLTGFNAASIVDGQIDFDRVFDIVV